MLLRLQPDTNKTDACPYYDRYGYVAPKTDAVSTDSGYWNYLLLGIGTTAIERVITGTFKKRQRMHHATCP